MKFHIPWFSRHKCVSNCSTGTRSLSIRMVWDALAANRWYNLFPQRTFTIITYNDAQEKEKLMLYLVGLMIQRKVPTTIFSWYMKDRRAAIRMFAEKIESSFENALLLSVQTPSANPDAEALCQMLKDERNNPFDKMLYAVLDDFNHVADPSQSIRMVEDLITDNPNYPLGVIAFHKVPF